MFSRQVVGVESNPAFHRVLQCPLLLEWKHDRLTLVVSSRDRHNKSFSALLSVEKWQTPTPMCFVERLLEGTQLFPESSGIMVTDVKPSKDGFIVAGMTFSDFNGLFHSEIFYFRSLPQSPLTPIHGTVRKMHADGKGNERFRTTPFLIADDNGISALYSASHPYSQSGRRSGFPSTYGLFYSSRLSSADDAVIFWPDENLHALASPTLDSQQTRLRFSIRNRQPSQKVYDLAELKIDLGSLPKRIRAQGWNVLREGVSYATTLNTPMGEWFVGSIGSWGHAGIELWTTAKRSPPRRDSA